MSGALDMGCNAWRLLTGGQAAAGLGASALGDVLPFGRIHVFLGLPGAGVNTGVVGTVVLTGFGDAEALFLAGVGSMRGGGGEADGGESGGKQGVALVHGESPW